MTGIIADLAQSARRLLATPSFTIATVLSLGLGVGVNAAVFTAANELLLKPLSVPRASELVRIYRGHHSPLSGAELREVQGARSFAHVFGETSYGASLVVGRTEPERVRVALASDNHFRALEVVPAAGRLFADGAAPGAAPEAVLSHEFWLRRFGGDPGVVGQGIRLNDRAFAVIGVAPPGRSSAQVGWWSDLVVPTRDARALTGIPVDSIEGAFYVTGRLAPGVSRSQADAELSVIASRIAQRDTAVGTFTLRVRPARGVTEEVRLPATVASAFLMAIGLLVLVMAATNVGNLMLARNAARRRELGVRMALGATRNRMVRLLLAEAVLLAIASAGAAWLLASWSAAWLPRILPPDIEVRFVLATDWRVLAMTLVATGGAMLLFGLVPARIALRRDVAEGIKAGSAIGQGVDGAKVRRRFLLAQVSLCAVLLATGSLFVRSLGRAGAVDVGFRPQGVVAAFVDLGGKPQSASERTAFFERLLADVKSAPGVESATYSRIAELTGSNSETTVITDASPDSAQARGVYTNTVGPDYHGTLGIPLVRGRDFATTDGAHAPPVVIVNETFAAREWPGEDPLGHRVSFDGPTGPWYEVVGLSRNVKYHTLGEGAKAFITVPQSQSPSAELYLQARVAPGAIARDVMATIVRLARSRDPLLAPPRTQLLTEMQSLALLPARAGAALLGGVGVLAFLLAAVGVGGVAAYTVAQRTREIGVRVALGASPAALLRSILGDIGATVASGAMIGLVLALGVGRLVSSQLYGVSYADPVTFVLVPLLLVVLAVGASLIPARRAMAISPTEALRSE